MILFIVKEKEDVVIPLNTFYTLILVPISLHMIVFNKLEQEIAEKVGEETELLQTVGN
jgi:hypothetical protein